MWDILILICFVILAFKVANSIFTSVESWIGRRRSVSEQSEKKTAEQKKPMKSFKQNSQKQTQKQQIRRKDEKQPEKQTKKITETHENLKQVKKQIEEQSLRVEKSSEKNQSKDIKEQQKKKQGDLSIKIESPILDRVAHSQMSSFQNDKNLLERLRTAEQQNKLLNLDIQTLKQDQKKYILQIEEIMEQIRKTQKNDESLNSSIIEPNLILQTNIKHERNIDNGYTIYDSKFVQSQQQKIVKYEEKIHSLEERLLEKAKTEGRQQQQAMIQSYMNENARLKEQIEYFNQQKQHYIEIIEQIINDVKIMQKGENKFKLSEMKPHETLRQLKQHLSQNRIYSQHIIKQLEEEKEHISKQIKQNYQHKIRLLHQQLAQQPAKQESSTKDEEKQKLIKELEQSKELIKKLREVGPESEAREELSVLRSKIKDMENDKEMIVKLRAKIAQMEEEKTSATKKQVDPLNQKAFSSRQEELHSKLNKLMNQYNQLVEQMKVAQSHARNQQSLTEAAMAQNSSIKLKLQKEIQDKQQLGQKFTDLQEELHFAQEQIKQNIESQNKLKKEVEYWKKAQQSERKSIQSVSGEGSGVKLHPELLKIRQKIAAKQLSQSHLIETQPITKEIKYGSPIDYRKTTLKTSNENMRRSNQRQFSPTFQVVPDSRAPSDRKVITRVPLSNNSPSGSNLRPVSTIYGDSNDLQIRHRTPQPNPRTIIQSSIHEGGILDQVFFSQSFILNDKQKQYVLNEIHHLKKISVKKTRMAYSSMGNKDQQRSISQFVSNVPNVLVVVELKNKKIVGAFTQSAFSRDLRVHFERIKPTNVLTKAMIMDITDQKSFRNQTGIDVISSEANELIWGKHQFVLNTIEPLKLSCNLNCEGAVYPGSYKNSEFLRVHGSSCSVTQFEVYRLFLG